MGARVTVTFEGLEEALSRLTEIGEKAEENLVKLTKDLADDGKDAWKEDTPRGKTGRLQDEEEAPPSGLSITFRSSTFYYLFVDEGHNTAKGWRRLRKVKGREVLVYVKAKRRSHVAGREMTQKLVAWLTQNTPEYLSKFLDGV